MKRVMLVFIFFVGILVFPEISFGYSNPFDLPNSWEWDNGDFYGEGDPYILKYNGTYYLYVSTVDDKSGVKAWTSEDLMDWDYAGLVTEEPSTEAAYAPEVTYWNGAFYMYTSPGGDGHYVYKSTSPLGPFEKQTENLGAGIDGHVFIDDDGQWYFYGTGSNYISAHEMEDPYTFGPEINTGAEMNGWTEAATVIKRNGKYYLTYAGNHVWSNAYRINYAVSDSPTSDFESADSQNPLLLNTEGSNVGLGHNGIVEGPDLDSELIVYHSHAKPGRVINMDRIGWNGDKMVVLGPTTFEQQNPNMPDFSDRFNRENLGSDWSTVNGGGWSIVNSEGDCALQQETIDKSTRQMQLTQFETEANYIAEFNMSMIEKGDSDNPRLGSVFSYQDENNYGLAVLNPNKNQLETTFVVDGVEQEWESSELPDEYDYEELHQIRVEKQDETFKIYVDGMHKQTRDINGLEGGMIGYTTTDVSASFGYIATSNQVNGSNILELNKPLPGTIEAVHYNSGGEGDGYHSTKDEVNDTYRNDEINIESNPEGGYSVNDFSADEWLSYNVNIEEEGSYDFNLRIATPKDGTKVRLWLDDEIDLTGVVSTPNTGAWDQWQSFLIDHVELPEGEHKITVEVVEEALNFAHFDVNKHKDVSVLFDDFNDGLDSGWKEYEGDFTVDEEDGVYRSNVESFGKSVNGESAWNNYSVEADVQVVNSEGDGGILFRVNNPVDGTEQNHNSPDMLQGYVAYINKAGVHLGKFNYDWEYLTGASLNSPIDEWQHIKVEADGTNIKVFVDDMERPKISYTDHSPTAFTHGSVGVRTFYSDTKYDNFLVKPSDSVSAILTKEGEDGERLEGVVFDLQDENGNKIREYTTDEKGQVIIDSLQPGKYQFQEMETIPGYVLNNDDVKEFEIENVQEEAVEISYVNDLKTGSVELTKTGDGKALEDATYSLLDEDGKEVEVELTTDDEGKIKVTNLKPGHYQFVETKASFGYSLDEAPLDFEIEFDQEEMLEITSESSLLTSDVKLIITGEDDERIEGAVFELQNSEGDTIEKGLESNEDGVIVVKDLTPGNYQFVETETVAGYELDSTPIPFEVELGQTEQTKIEFVSELTTGSVELKTVDEEGQALQGAEFKLLDEKDNVLKSNLTTDANGNIIVTDLKPGHYKFVEIQSPSGYELDETEIDFTISKGETEPVEVNVVNEKSSDVAKPDESGAIDDDDNEGTQEPGKTESGDGGSLPSTATNIFNLTLIGLGFLLTGVILLYLKRRKIS